MSRQRVGARREPRGVAMVEFALVALTFFILVFAIMEMGDAVFTHNSLGRAARAAVRYAIVHSPTSPNRATVGEIKQVAIDAAPGLRLRAGQIAVSWPADANLPSLDDARVVITYRYVFRLAFIPPVTLTASSRMLVSQ